MNTFLLAGYETTSSKICLSDIIAALLQLTFSLPESSCSHSMCLLPGFICGDLTYMPRNQWALIELSKHPNTQDNLHAELLQHFSIGDPSWEQLMNADTLPYLDAVVHEVLRLHPPVPRIIRVVHGFFLVNCSKDSDRDDL